MVTAPVFVDALADTVLFLSGDFPFSHRSTLLIRAIPTFPIFNVIIFYLPARQRKEN
jgi:hypothetical protein